MSERKHEAMTFTREFVLLNQLGLHARPAALFVKAASRFDADIAVEKDGNRVSGKSIMGLITLAASGGSRLKVTVTGQDGEQLLDQLAALISSKFGDD